jgi:hypothetical protein
VLVKEHAVELQHLFLESLANSKCVWPAPPRAIDSPTILELLSLFALQFRAASGLPNADSFGGGGACAPTKSVKILLQHDAKQLLGKLSQRLPGVEAAQAVESQSSLETPRCGCASATRQLPSVQTFGASLHRDQTCQLSQKDQSN